MANQPIVTVGDKTKVMLDDFIIEVEGKHLTVYEKKLIGTKKIYERGRD